MTRLLILLAAGVALLTGCAFVPPPPTAGTSGDPALLELMTEQGVPECPPTDPEATAVRDGLPALELPCLGSGTAVNVADLAGRPMVINFWAQWCDPCRIESPYLQEAYEATDEVEFVGVNYDDSDEVAALEFAGFAGLEYPHIRDRHKQLQDVGVPGLPVTIFVAANGRISGRHVGQIESTEQLQDMMQEFLGTS